jgi:hypothetical protein
VPASFSQTSKKTLPPTHYLEAPLLTRELRPGATERVEFRVLPRKRVLRFIDDG